MTDERQLEELKAVFRARRDKHKSSVLICQLQELRALYKIIFGEELEP